MIYAKSPEYGIENYNAGTFQYDVDQMDNEKANGHA